MNSKKINELGKLFTNRGFNPVIGTIYKQQEKWLNWYRGNVNDFHYYKIKTTNGKSVDKKKPSLQMAKKVCEDWASLLFNERSGVTIENAETQKVLNDVLDANFFKDEISNFLELSMMNGTGVIVEYKSDGETKIDFIYGNTIMVLSYENSTPTEIAVIQEFQKEKEYYTHVMYLLYEDGLYTIEHEMYKSKKSGQLGNQCSLDVMFSESEISAMEHVEKVDDKEIVRYYVQYETDTPHFQIFKPAITNNFDVNSPMGISVIGNAIDPIGGVDTGYHSYLEDNINSRKKIFLDNESTRTNKSKAVDAQGNISIRSVEYVDRDATVFQSVDLGEKKMEIYDPTFDVTPHEMGIQMSLNLVSFLCGLGTDYYNFKNGTVYVNEKSVLSSTSDLWRNRQKNITRLKDVLYRMTKSILYLEDVNTEVTIEVNIDDSIIEDDESRLIKVKEMADSGKIPPYYYTAQALKISLEEAKALYMENKAIDQAEAQAFLDGLEDGEE